MYCPRCGAENADDAVECVRCRESIEPVAPPSSPSIGDDAGMRMLLPVGRSGFAIAAGYLGLFSLFFFIIGGLVALGGRPGEREPFLWCVALFSLGPMGLALSIWAIRDIRRNPKKHGMGRAIFGLIVGVLGTGVLILIVLAFATH